MEVFLYLLDMYIDFQFILSSCGWMGNKCMVGVGLPLPHQTKSFVPVLYTPTFSLPLVTTSWVVAGIDRVIILSL